MLEDCPSCLVIGGLERTLSTAHGVWRSHELAPKRTGRTWKAAETRLQQGVIKIMPSMLQDLLR